MSPPLTVIVPVDVPVTAPLMLIPPVRGLIVIVWLVAVLFPLLAPVNAVRVALLDNTSTLFRFREVPLRVGVADVVVVIPPPAFVLIRIFSPALRDICIGPAEAMVSADVFLATTGAKVFWAMACIVEEVVVL